MRPLAALRRVSRRLGWGVADQGVSSLTNFAVNIYIARELGAVQYGAFSLAYVTYSFALNASRGLATDPLLVRFSYTDPAIGAAPSPVAPGLPRSSGWLREHAYWRPPWP